MNFFCCFFNSIFQSLILKIFLVIEYVLFDTNCGENLLLNIRRDENEKRRKYFKGTFG